MGWGGKRTGAGKKSFAEQDKPHADRSFAGKLIAILSRFDAKKDEPDEIAQWRPLWWSTEQRIQLDTRKYWYDKRDGKAVHTVNHLHDKPIDLNVNVSIAEIVRKVRERKLLYERSR